MPFEELGLLGLSQYFDWCCSAFFSCALTCESNRPSFLATVFREASIFNGDLKQWDVANVNNMLYSKSIRVVENDPTWRELMTIV